MRLLVVPYLLLLKKLVDDGHTIGEAFENISKVAFAVVNLEAWSLKKCFEDFAERYIFLSLIADQRIYILMIITNFN